MSRRLLDLISTNGPVTATELSQHLHISLTLATQYLLTAEQLGALCRDEVLEATRFYKNIF
jgi:ESCRT-II complex subunit VPS36